MRIEECKHNLPVRVNQIREEPILGFVDEVHSDRGYVSLTCFEFVTTTTYIEFGVSVPVDWCEPNE